MTKMAFQVKTGVSAALDPWAVQLTRIKDKLHKGTHSLTNSLTHSLSPLTSTALGSTSPSLLTPTSV